MLPYRAAPALEPGEPDYDYGLGVALEQLQRPDESDDDDAKALQLKPAHAEAHSNLGTLLLNRDETVQRWEQALRLNPNLPGVAGELTHVRDEIAANQTSAAP